MFSSSIFHFYHFHRLQPPEKINPVPSVLVVGLINHFGKRDNVFLAAVVSILYIFRFRIYAAIRT